jgi:hypothetical protein
MAAAMTKRSTPKSVLNIMRKKGRVLHSQCRWFGREFRLSDGTVVDLAVARIVTKSKSVVSVGDVLFGGMPAQSWRYVETPEVVRPQQRRTTQP